VSRRSRFGSWLAPKIGKAAYVASRIMALGTMYFCLMMAGARIIRRPPGGWITSA